MDISEIDVKKGKAYLMDKHLPTNRLCVGDASNIPFSANSFDVVLMVDLLEHTSSPQLIVNEIFRILKPCGKVLVATPWQHHPVWNPCVKKMMSGRNNIDEVPDIFQSRKDLRRLFVNFHEEYLGLKVFLAWLVAVYKK